MTSKKHEEHVTRVTIARWPKRGERVSVQSQPPTSFHLATMSSELVNIDAVIVRDVKTKSRDSGPGIERMEESSSTPPSSPPLVKQDAVNDVPFVTKKRSHEEMTTEQDVGTESSATVIGDSEQTASQAGKEIDLSVVSSLSTPTRSMPPPAKPSSNMTPPTQKPPRSGQGTVTPDVPSQPVVVKEAAHSQAKSEASTSVDDANPSEPSDESSSFEDPQDKIEDFAWTDLEQRYHNEMKQFEITEQQIMSEFDGLSQV